MARYSVDPDYYRNTELHPDGSVAAFDGDGREIEDLLAVDTELGLAIVLRRGPNGEYLQDRRGQAVPTRRYVKRPITFRKVNDDGSLGVIHG
jgi:hypothetical protein